MTSTTNTRPLVVGFDGSPVAEGAVRWAATAAARAGTELIVLHAADRIHYAQDETYGIWDPAAVQEASVELAERGARLARETEPDLGVRAQGSLLSPRHALDEAATHAQGVVVGTRGLGRIRSTLLGATAYGVTGHARCPVTVVPEGAPTPGPGPGAHVVVGVDGSAASERAADAAAVLARQWEAELLVVSVWERPHTEPWGVSYEGYATPEAASEALLQRASARVEQVVDRLAQEHPELTLRTAVPMGRPEETLLEAARGAGLLVLGSHGSGRWTSLVLGSTTRNILQLADLAVHIVR